MKNSIVVPFLFAGLTISSVAAAQAVVGQPAPSISATDFSGKPVSLDQFKGKYVVMEWFNPDCPFVQKHYNSGNMPAVQKYAVEKGIVWVTVNTGNKPKNVPEMAEWLRVKKSSPSVTVLDTDGKVGKAYGARTTPHMYLIDPTGKLVYAGAIDSKPTANVEDIKTATNYVVQAIDESLAGKPVSQPVTKAYGCSVKYGWFN